MRLSTIRRLLKAGIVLGGTAVVVATVIPELAVRAKEGCASKSTGKCVMCPDDQKKSMYNPLPTREDIHKSLQEEEFDILVIGGGATGAGVALDAVTRGLKIALVERGDFGSGTSSRSTKLIHGGVRYLQKAIFSLDHEQYRMVQEALYERANLLEIAPHLAKPLPIMLPVYHWWQLPYYWAGIKMYDIVSGSQVLQPSCLISKMRALEHFPMLNAENLVGALIYYDGQHDDARMNVALAITAIRYGASASNYVEVQSLKKQPGPDGCGEQVCGALVKDLLTGKEWEIRAKVVVNATGPYTDKIRLMGNEKTKKICQPSSGVHIVLPDYFCPASMGLIDPNTSDGRVLFFLPWQRVTLVGTTDNPTEVSSHPQPMEKDIMFILKEIRRYLSPEVDIRREDVQSAWAGIRPLVVDPNKADTQSIARNHIIEVSPEGLVTIAGGKWTTYRHMAEETVDTAIRTGDLQPTTGCRTKGLLLDGAHGFTPTLSIQLVQQFGFDKHVAQHLANTYGDKALEVAKLASPTGKVWPVVGVRLHEKYPYIDADVKYAIREYASTATDILARRTRIAFCDAYAAREALPEIIEIMGKELGWSDKRKQAEFSRADVFLRREMGLDMREKKE